MIDHLSSWAIRLGLGMMFVLCAGPGRTAPLSCSEAAVIAESTHGIPAGLLLAIGVIESGRPDANGKRTPWPWSVQSNGVGKYYLSPDAAIAAVQSLRASGVQSIDIGCFQINLFHHPHAFADLASGFDPLTNAYAAARFLASLRDEFGAWEPAIAAYHSRVETAGTLYRNMVLAAWHGTPVPIGTLRLALGFRIWGPAGEIGRSAQPLPAGSWITMPQMLMTAR